jgi:glyoxylase-like metal-dependent hydrolase (beta-lactamase superfamily II)
LAGDKSLDPGEERGKLRGSYPGAKTKPTRTLSPGDRVGSLEVVASPGHTPGHVAFLDTRDRTLICGDAFSTLGGVETTARVNRRFPLPTLATWHRPKALESARALRALEPARLAPGHGKVVESPLAAMDAAIARAAG